MHLVGITGGVGTGKSEVIRILSMREDTRVLMADEVAHLLMKKGGSCYEQIIAMFPHENLLGNDLEFDRNRLAEAIFRDENRRFQVNSIVHPAVKEYVRAEIEREKSLGKYTFFFFEAALLIEEHYDEILDELWYIYTDEKIRRERLKSSRGYSDEKIDFIMKSQRSEEEFELYCSEKIVNNGTVGELEDEIAALLRRKIHEGQGVWS